MRATRPAPLRLVVLPVVLFEPCGDVHVLVKNADDADNAVLQFAKKDVVMLKPNEPNSAQRFVGHLSPMATLLAEFLGRFDEGADLRIGLRFVQLFERVIPNLDQPFLCGGENSNRHLLFGGLLPLRAMLPHPAGQTWIHPPRFPPSIHRQAHSIFVLHRAQNPAARDHQYTRSQNCRARMGRRGLG